MTVVVWDGITLAADKKISCGNTQHKSTKIFRLNNGDLAGYAGEVGLCLEFIAWLNSDRSVDTFPPSKRELENLVDILVVTKDRLLFYDRSPYPIVIEEKRHAIGSGANYALAAMHCGKSAIEAVKIASIFDPSCGLGVDKLQHK